MGKNLKSYSLSIRKKIRGTKIYLSKRHILANIKKISAGMLKQSLHSKSSKITVILYSVNSSVCKGGYLNLRFSRVCCSALQFQSPNVSQEKKQVTKLLDSKVTVDSKHRVYLAKSFLSH